MWTIYMPNDALFENWRKWSSRKILYISYFRATHNSSNVLVIEKIELRVLVGFEKIRFLIEDERLG